MRRRHQTFASLRQSAGITKLQRLHRSGCKMQATCSTSGLRGGQTRDQQDNSRLFHCTMMRASAFQINPILLRACVEHACASACCAAVTACTGAGRRAVFATGHCTPVRASVLRTVVLLFNYRDRWFCVEWVGPGTSYDDIVCSSAPQSAVATARCMAVDWSVIYTATTWALPRPPPQRSPLQRIVAAGRHSTRVCLVTVCPA